VGKVKYSEYVWICPVCGGWNKVGPLKKIGDREVKCSGKRGWKCSHVVNISIEKESFTYTMTRNRIVSIEGGVKHEYSEKTN